MTQPTEPLDKPDKDKERTLVTGLGAVSGAGFGAGIGSTLGPAGTLLGATLGAVAGRETAEALDPLDVGGDDDHWRSEFRKRPYVTDDCDYERWRLAYIYGWEMRRLTWDRNWSDIEAELERGWNDLQDTCEMEWKEARQAAREAWDHSEKRTLQWFDEEEQEWKTSPRPATPDPAFRFGMVSRYQHPETEWDDLEEAFAESWDRFEDSAEAAWDSIRDTVKEGWQRFGRRLSAGSRAGAHS